MKNIFFVSDKFLILRYIDRLLQITNFQWQ